jgi:hypothetical protein
MIIRTYSIEKKDAHVWWSYVWHESKRCNRVRETEQGNKRIIIQQESGQTTTTHLDDVMREQGSEIAMVGNVFGAIVAVLSRLYS